MAVYQKEKPDLYAVDQQGKIVKIEDFMEKAIREEILVRIGSQNQSTRLGRRTWIALIPPVFDGNPDLLLGTGAGGLIYLKSTASDSSTEDFILQIFPNPSLGPIKIITNKDSKVTMINALGQSLLSGITVPKNLATELQTGFLPPGIYFLRFEVDGKFMETRKVWIR